MRYIYPEDIYSES